MQESVREVARGKVQLDVSDLAFSEIPGQSRLFLDYLDDPVSLRRFYPNAVALPSDLASFAPEVLGNYRTDRPALCDALTDINAAAGAGPKAFENIEKLRDASCVAVVTGQQAGLLTGPLYTIYKALSAERTARALSEQGIPAVPIFWIATEDHDFDEVSRAFVIGSGGEIVEAKYEATDEFAGNPVGDVILDSSITGVIDGLFDQMPVTEFSADLKSAFLDQWKEGFGYGDAFARTMAFLFQKCGLIFIDPMNPKIKALSAPMFATALKRSDEIADALLARSRELDGAGYHSQVLIEGNHVPMFWIADDGKRIALRKSGENSFRAKAARTELTRDELIRLAKDDPARLSPAVMLRPVVQDYLLPTICYLGGGAEIAYFAQNSEVYRVLERPVTPIFHRQSFTVVEPRQRRVLDRFALDLTGLFDGLEKVSLSIAEWQAAADSAKLFTEVEDEINSGLDRLDQRLSGIDSTLADSLTKRRRKIVYHVAALRKKTLLPQLRKDETSSRQLGDLFSALLPHGGLQERTLNVIAFLNKYGPNFVDWIYQVTDVTRKTHRIADL